MSGCLTAAARRGEGYRRPLETIANRLVLATTTTSVVENRDISVGGFRPLNLEAAPFALGPPAYNLRDDGPRDPSKYVGAWRLPNRDTY